MVTSHPVRANAAAALVLAVLAGCAPTPSSDLSTTSPAASATPLRAQVCAEAADSVVAAVANLVTSYETPAAQESPDPSREPSATPQASPATGDDVTSAVAQAQRTLERLDCDRAAFNADLEAGLAAIEPSGAIATAVWRRVSASVLGDVEQQAGERTLKPAEDLSTAIARAAPGSTLVLPAGVTELPGTLVLLDGVTLRGEGREATTLASSAPEAAIIVATDGRVELRDLTLTLSGGTPASGVVAGPSASLVLAGVRIAGAPIGDAGSGGAGVYMSAEGEQGSGRGTTLEVTDSLFEGNGWAGIAVAGGHRVSIEASTFAGNGEVGMLFLDSASGSVAASTFTDNTVGLAATGASTPTWLASTVSGGSIGLQLDGTAAPTIDGMRVEGSASAAVVVGGEATGSIGHTTCADVPYGIVISDAAAPTLVDNTCELARGAS